MPITTGQILVGTTAVQVNTPNVNPSRIQIHNNDNTNNLLIGNGSVTASNGLMLPKLDSLEIVLNPNEILYLLASAGTIQASYLIQTE